MLLLAFCPPRRTSTSNPHPQPARRAPPAFGAPKAKGQLFFFFTLAEGVPFVGSNQDQFIAAEAFDAFAESSKEAVIMLVEVSCFIFYFPFFKSSFFFPRSCGQLPSLCLHKELALPAASHLLSAPVVTDVASAFVWCESRPLLLRSVGPAASWRRGSGAAGGSRLFASHRLPLVSVMTS